RELPQLEQPRPPRRMPRLAVKHHEIAPRRVAPVERHARFHAPRNRARRMLCVAPLVPVPPLPLHHDHRPLRAPPPGPAAAQPPDLLPLAHRVLAHGFPASPLSSPTMFAATRTSDGASKSRFV